MSASHFGVSDTLDRVYIFLDLQNYTYIATIFADTTKSGKHIIIIIRVNGSVDESVSEQHGIEFLK